MEKDVFTVSVMEELTIFIESSLYKGRRGKGGREGGEGRRELMDANGC